MALLFISKANNIKSYFFKIPRNDFEGSPMVNAVPPGKILKLKLIICLMIKAPGFWQVRIKYFYISSLPNGSLKPRIQVSLHCFINPNIPRGTVPVRHLTHPECLFIDCPPREYAAKTIRREPNHHWPHRWSNRFRPLARHNPWSDFYNFSKSTGQTSSALS